MTRIFYNKLVRDRIPEIIHQDERKCDVVSMTDHEYERAIREKLVEEAQQADKADTTSLLTELADLQEVILALMEFHGISVDLVEATRVQRHQDRGGFEKRLKLLWTE